MLYKTTGITKYDVSICEICGNQIASSHYHLPVEIKEANKIKFSHIECCSSKEIKQNLLRHAQDQIKMYQDIINLLENLNSEEIEKFGRKYGTYEEISQGIQIDRELTICALIAELKRKVESKSA